MAQRPYRLRGRRHLNALRVHLQQRLVEWTGTWLAHADLPGLEIRSVSKPDGADLRLRCMSAADGRWLALGWAADGGFTAVGRMLGAASAVRGRLARDLGEQALRDLGRRLIDSDGFETSPESLPLPEEVWLPGAGGIAVDASFPGFALHLVIGGAVVDDLLRDCCPARPSEALPPLSSLVMAMGAQPVPLNVSLGVAELPLQAVATLRIGDVIRLDKPLGEPLALSGPEGAELCPVALGRRRGKLAVQLMTPAD
jgi:hypothetical protein